MVGSLTTDFQSMGEERMAQLTLTEDFYNDWLSAFGGLDERVKLDRRLFKKRVLNMLEYFL